MHHLATIHMLQTTDATLYHSASINANDILTILGHDWTCTENKIKQATNNNHHHNKDIQEAQLSPRHCKSVAHCDIKLEITRNDNHL